MKRTLNRIKIFRERKPVNANSPQDSASPVTDSTTTPGLSDKAEPYGYTADPVATDSVVTKHGDENQKTTIQENAIASLTEERALVITEVNPRLQETEGKPESVEGAAMVIDSPRMEEELEYPPLDVPDDESIAPNAEPLLSRTLEEWAAELWDRAYDSLKDEEVKLMQSYEVIVSAYLAKNDRFDRPVRRPSVIMQSRNSIAHTDRSERQAQMSNVLNAWLKEPDQGNVTEIESKSDEKNSSDEESDSEGMSSDSSTDEPRTLKSILRETIEADLNVPLVWVTIFLAVENLHDPFFRPQAVHSRVISVVSKMKWYIGLSRMLFVRDSTYDEPDNPQVHALISLYKAILSYEIRIASWLSSKASKSRPLLELSQLNPYADEILIREEKLVASFDEHQLRAHLIEILAGQPDSEELAAEDKMIGVRELLGKLNVDEPSHPGLRTNDGNILELLYEWANTTPEYSAFIDWSPQNKCSVLWVHGAAGAGKTMLLQAAVQKLPEQGEGTSDPESPKNVAYFFCDDRKFWQGNALSVVKSLISHVLTCQPSLSHYLSDAFEKTDREAFDNLSDFYAMSTVFYEMIKDSEFSPTYFVIDTIEQLASDDDANMDTELPPSPRFTDNGGPKDPLDERGLKDLLVLISTSSQLAVDKVKWLLSLDTDLRDDIDLQCLRDRMQSHLTIDSSYEEIREIANKYAVSRVARIADKANYKGNLREVVTDKIQEISPGNFMWLKMVLDIVASTIPWNVPDLLDRIQKECSDIGSLFDSSRNTMGGSGKHDSVYCQDILSATAIAYQPLLASELVAMIELPQEVDLVTIVDSMLLHFLKIWDDRVYFSHRSAKAFHRQKMETHGVLKEHAKIAQRCLEILRKALVKNGSKASDPIGYATVFWIRHLSEVIGEVRDDTESTDAESIAVATKKAMVSATDMFEGHLIQWLKLLDMQDLLPKALGMMDKLNVVLTTKIRQPVSADIGSVIQSIRDVTTFMRLHQVLTAASIRQDVGPENSLLFSPESTTIRQKFLPRYFPWLAAAPRLATKDALNGCLFVATHHDWVRGCCFSSDGRLVASASDERCVLLWDVETGKLQKVLEGFGGYVYGVVMSNTSPDGYPVLAAFEYDLIQLWAGTTCKLIQGIHGVTQGEGEAEEASDAAANYVNDSVLDISITTAGDRLAAAVGKGVTVWDVPDTDKVTVWLDEETDRIVRRVCFSPNGDLLASTTGAEITIWDTKTGRPHHRLPERKTLPEKSPEENLQVEEKRGHKSDIDGLTFSPDGKFLASGSDDKTARIWDVKGCETVAVLVFHESHVNGVSFSANGTRLATASSDKSIGIWKQRLGDWGSERVRRQPDQVLYGHANTVWSVAFAPYSDLLASASQDRALRLWDTRRSEELVSEEDLHQTTSNGISTGPGPGPGHRVAVSCVAVSPDNKTIASASDDGTICIWDGGTGARRRTLEERHGRQVTDLVFSVSAKYLVSASADRQAFVWDLVSTEVKMTPKHRLTGHTNWLRGAAISPDEKLVATACDDETVRLWNIAAAAASAVGGSDNDVPVSVFEGHADYVYSVAFSPDGTCLVSGGDDCHVMVWNLAATTNKNEMQANKEKPDTKMSDPRVREYIRNVVFSPDGTLVFSVSVFGTVAVWRADAPEGKQCRLIVELDDTRVFRSMYFDPRHPDVLLTEFGAWDYDASREAIDTAEAATAAAIAADADTDTETDVPVDTDSELEPESTPTPSKVLPLRKAPPSWAPLGVDAGNRWITWNNSNVIALPNQFRPDGACRVQGHSVVIGCRSGQVLLFRFSEDCDPLSGVDD